MASAGLSSEEVLVLRMPVALTVDALQQILDGASAEHARTVIIDASEMRSYTPEARGRFIQFARTLPPRTRLGIITENTMWRMVISAMALAASREIRVFPNRVAARVWSSPSESATL